MKRQQLSAGLAEKKKTAASCRHGRKEKNSSFLPNRRENCCFHFDLF